MFCTKCGAQNEDNARFCTTCGQTLDSPVAEGTELLNEQPFFQAAPSLEEMEAPENVPVDSQRQPPEEAPKKKLNPIIFIAAGAAVVLTLVLILALCLGGGSPEKVVKTYFEAQFTQDAVVGAECYGYDYVESRLEWFDDDVDDLVDWFQEYYFDDDDYWEEYYEEVGMDLAEWEDRLDEVEDEEDYIQFQMDFFAEHQKLYNKEYECSYEITRLESEKLSGRDLRDAEDYLEEWYEEKEDADYVLLFEEDDVKSFYVVSCKVKYEDDGDKDTENFDILVVKTSKGYFILDLYWDN